MDYSRHVRRVVLSALKADGLVTALIPAGSIYPSTVPATRTFPFTRYGAPQASPFRASGLNSSSLRPTVHAFTKPLYAGGLPTGALLATAECQAENMAAAIKACLDERVLALEGGMTVTLTWLGSNCMQDPTETDAWHAIVNFLGEVAG
jgi:hypothetical protein